MISQPIPSRRLTFTTLTFIALLGLAPVVAMAAVGQPTADSKSSPEAAKKAELVSAYGKLPLSFIQNDGQVDKKVKFYEKGSGHATFFTKDGVYLSLTKDQNAASSNALIKLIPLGANKNFKIVPEGLQEGKINYFIGKDPKKWKTNIPTYQSVVYQEVYPGIDLKFYGNNRQMEYDVIVKPGADPSKVKFTYEGIEGLRVTDDGDLEIALKGGTVFQKKPVIYQEIDGKRVDVAGTFKIQPRTNRRAKNFAYGFEVASYDRAHSLLIDPTLIYSTYLGGSDGDSGIDVAVDSAGNAYVTGSTGSSDFPTMNPLQAVSGGSGDAFVTKLNATGTALAYSTYLGGSGGDSGRGIAVDGSGNVYVIGDTDSSNFPTLNPLQAVSGGGADTFVAKLNATGTALVYSTYLGGSGADAGHGIVVDGSNNAYVTGNTLSSDFPTVNALQAVSGGGNDVFVSNLNATGTALLYSTYLGGSGNEQGFGIAVDSAGNGYVTGETSSSDFPTASALYGSNAGGDADGFVTKLNASGSTLIYSTYLGGSGDDGGAGIAVDGSGNAYVIGGTDSPNFPTANALQATLSGPDDTFVSKLNATGTALVYSTYLGGSGADLGAGIAVDGSGNAYVTGGTNSSNFPTVNALQTVYGGGGDVFVSNLNATGTALVYSTYLGGSGGDAGSRIAVDGSGSAYVTGGTNSSNFPTVNALQAVSGGGSGDAFVAKIGPTQYTLSVTKTGTGGGTVTSSPPGINCDPTCSALFDPGTVVTLTATTNVGSAFTGWSGSGCVGIGTCVVTMNAAKSVTASFTDGATLPITSVSPNTVTYVTTSSRSVTINGSGFVAGATITVGSLSGTTVAVAGSATATNPFVYTSPTNIKFYWANTSLDAGTYDVQVTNPSGDFGLLANGFTVVGLQPTVTSVTPATVTYGSTANASVTIAGTNFRLGSTITVGTLSGVTVSGSTATAATPFVYASATSVKFYWANTSLAAGVYDVVVTNPTESGGLSATRTNGFTVNPLQPTVTSVTPATVTYGSTSNASVTIAGTNFRLGSTITVGTLSGVTVAGSTASAATPFVYASATSVKFYWANTSLDAGVYDVVVTNPAESGGLSATRTNGFTVNGLQPTVTSVTPATVTYGSTSNTSVTIAGTNFRAGATITVGTLTGTTVAVGGNATAANPFVYTSATQVKFWWNNTSLAPGIYDVQVTNPAAAGGLTGTRTSGFTVNGLQPTVTSVTPASVSYLGTANTSVTITGTNFRAGATITVGTLTGTTVQSAGNATAANPFVYTSATQVKFWWNNTSLPIGAYDVQVTDPADTGGLTGTLVNGFTVLAPQPIITAVSPVVIFGVSASQSITITGSNFVLGSTISVGTLSGTTVAVTGNATAANPFVFTSSTQIKFFWPSTSLPYGLYDVLVTNPAAVGELTGTRTNGFTVALQPTVTSVTPSALIHGVSTSQAVTLTGTNFLEGSTITVGSLSGTTVSGTTASEATPFVFVSPTQVQFYWENTSLTPAVYFPQVTNPASAGGLTGTLANGFGFTIIAPQPTVTTVSPASVTFGTTPSQSITINGTNFLEGTTIAVGALTGTTVPGTTATAGTPFVYISSTQLAFYWSNTSLSVGTYNVQVTSPASAGGLSFTLANSFSVVVLGQPTVTSATPSVVAFGSTPSQSVTITGTNFLVGSTITVGSLTGTTVSGETATAGTPYVFVSSTQLAFYWPNTSLPLGSYNIQVTSPAAAGSLTGTLFNGFLVATQPTIASLTPSSVTYGTTASTSVTIAGTNFAAGATITVGTLSGTTVAVGGNATTTNPFVYTSATNIKFYWANTSLPAGVYDVHVTNPSGVTVTRVAGFTVLGIQPTVTAVTPATVTFGSTTSASVTIGGTNFRPGATITVGTLSGTTVAVAGNATTTNPFVYTSATNIKFYWANTSLPAGVYDVVVTNPADSGGLSATRTNGFTVNPLQPTVTAVTPAVVTYGSTANASVTIAGTNFRPGATITVGTISGTTVAVAGNASAINPFVYTSATNIKFYWANTSLSAGVYDVQVTNPADSGGLSATRTNGFTVNPLQPTVTTVTPAAVTYGLTANSSVTIGGTNFRPGSTITVGTISGTTVAVGGNASAANPFVYTSATQVKFYWANTSLNAGTYDVQVTNPAESGGLSATLTNGFTVNALQPTVTAVTPAAVTYGLTANSSVTIAGTNFRPGATITVGTISGTTVSVGGNATATNPFVYTSATNIKFYWANTSLDAGVYDVVVTNPAESGGLSATRTGGFTVNGLQPTVTSVTPASVTFGVTSSQSVTIAGTNFRLGATITVGSLSGTTATGSTATAGNPFVYVSPTQVKFYWQNLSLPVDSYTVTVTDPAEAGGLSGSLANGFTVN